ncbi:uncharacterized protein M6B38_253445 [Iris pallida]|uniref:Uncharacterized protein n=1 Tax=Iris pallida TaxID=29817 RepID=A0AAX6IHR5_IRIPA|nr:uncharacterized protein M6B38_253445 [Iris pallida]
MNLSLDETLGNANPHYTRIAREKIAAKEAARKAMEARKAAMVEASWCRILRAARIQSKRAEAELQKAEKCAAEAFEAAKAKGVMMYDRPDCPRPCEIESTGGGSTHTVTASFETAFEVDKEVMAAVKNAFIQLANCPSSSNREEFKGLLWKISQNPDISETDSELPEASSECESDLSEGGNEKKQTNKCRQLLDGSDINKPFSELVNVMLDRLKGLQEDELASLAIIVATCGLNAALLELENGKDHHIDPVTSCTQDSTVRQGSGARRNSSVGQGSLNRKEPHMEVPSLDKLLVKHVSKLEREVQEARNRNSRCQQTPGSKVRAFENSKATSLDFASDLGSVLVKHVSKLEKEIQEVKAQKKNAPIENGNILCQSGSMPCEIESKELGKSQGLADDMQQCDLKLHRAVSYKENIDSSNLMPSSLKAEKKHQANELTEVSPVKHISRIERAKLEAQEQSGLDKILIKPVSRLEREKMQVMDRKDEYAFQRNRRKQGSDVTASESLDKILVKHVSRLEKEKLAVRTNEGARAVKKQDQKTQNIESLDEILVKHQSKLEKAKLAAPQKPFESMVKHRKQATEVTASESLDKVLVKHQPELEKAKLAAAMRSDDYITTKPVDARREARQRELQEAWGGLSLGNSVRPHLSRLERDKAAWKRAEEEEGMQVTGT